MIKAVFFDFDGVIAESLNAKTEAFYQMYLPYGEDIAGKAKRHHLENGGISRFEKFRLYHHDFLGIDLSPEEIQTLADDFSSRVLEQVIQAPFVPGALEAIQKLHAAGYKLFVISGTPHDEMAAIVKSRNLDSYFLKVCGSPTGKKEWSRKLMDAHALTPDQVVFVGDATTDYDAAAFHKMHYVLREHPDNVEFFKEYTGARMADLFQLPELIQKEL